MALFNIGNFKLHSGATSTFKIDCDWLTHSDFAALAKIGANIVGPYGKVIGIPRGGIEFAHHLEKYCDPASDALLIVDDVYTTGASMHAMREKHLGISDQRIVGLVIFSRSVHVPAWIHPIFTLNGFGVR